MRGAAVVGRVAVTVAADNADLIIDAMTWGAVVHVDVDAEQDAGPAEQAPPQAMDCNDAMAELARTGAAQLPSYCF